jgi:hypothetical protein
MDMEETKNNTGQSLGIAALITAIVTFVLAVIPCVGLIAIIPGIIAIVLAAVGLSNAAKTDAPRGILLAGLIIAIIASLISFSQVFGAGKIAEKANQWPSKIEDIVNDVQDNVLKDLEDANVSIKIESGDDKIEIRTDTNKGNREKTLEELEKEETSGNDSVSKK